MKIQCISNTVKFNNSKMNFKGTTYPQQNSVILEDKEISKEVAEASKAVSQVNVPQNTTNTNVNSFEKQSSNISFTGLRKPKNKQKEDNELNSKINYNIKDSLKNVPLEGIPFLLGLATSAAMVKMGEGAKELLNSSTGYFVSDNGVKSDLINIDKAKGIIEFLGTGISINSAKCDIADWENGIFRNYDGSIDIDLGNNKFIDTIHGIFVDPAEKISAVLDGDKLQSMAIPSFTGYQVWPNPVLSRNTVADVKDETPIEKLCDFFNKLFKKDSMPQAENIKDIFGNEIVVAKDKDGDTYLAPYMKSIAENPIFKEFAQGMDKEDAIETSNDIRLKQYMDKNYPNFGTRIMVYEGGRNATGPRSTIKPFEICKKDMVEETLKKLKYNANYVPEQGSEEAKNFAIYQQRMMKLHGWKEPKIDPNLLLGKNIDLDGDGIPDFDRNGDGKIDYSSDGKPKGMQGLKFLFGVMDKDGNGKISREEIAEFIRNMDEDGNGKVSIGEIVNFFKELFEGK